MNPHHWSSAWVAIPSLGLIGALALIPWPGPWRAFAIHGLGALMALAMLVAALRRSKREPAFRWAWGFLAGHAALSLLYRSLNLHTLATQRAPLAHHAFRDALLWNVAVMLLFLALLAFARRQGPLGSTWMRVLDGLIFSTAFYFLLWIDVVGPLHGSAGLPADFSLASQALFALTAAGLGLGLHAMVRQGTFRGPAGALVLMLVGFAIVFPWSLKASLEGSYPLDHPARFIGLAATLMGLMAALLPVPRLRRTAYTDLADLLPYVPAGLAFLRLMALVLAPALKVDPVAMVLVGLVCGLLVTRQALSVVEVEAFRHGLEQEVETRTRDVLAQESLLQRTENMNLVANLGAGLAHDLNNLVGGAAMQAELLQETSGGQGPEVTRQLVALRRTLDSASDLTRRLMAVGREEAVSPLDLAAHLQGMTPLLRSMVPPGLALEWDLPASPCPVACAAGQMDQMVVNLVVNARDALSPGGRIRIVLRRSGVFVEIRVQDTGSGIAPESMAHIFDPFFTTKAVGKGTGLGLASVKAVAERLGGTVAVESQRGRGSTFTITLPLASSVGAA